MKTSIKNIKSLAGILLVIVWLMSGIPVKAALPIDQNLAQATKCVLSDCNTISLIATLPEIPASDDGILYVYELQPYEYAVSMQAVPIASAPLSLTPAFSFSSKGPYGSRLYTKFVMAVKVGGQNVMISYPQYITNPELLATHTKPRKQRGKKSVQGEDFANLFISSNLPGILQGNYTTVQVMNQGNNQTVTNPYARAAIVGADTHPVTPRYYMLNASDAAGIAAITSEVASCAANSTAENFIIGNEVNVRTWNYMIWTDWDNYIKEYAQVFRVAYNAIKSQNANARVYVCMDQNWDRNRTAGHREYYEYIDAKDFLIKFNAFIANEGNIDWCLAQHPYTVPLTYSKFWDMSGCANGGYMASQVASGKMVTFQNLSVITNFMTTPQMLSPKGTVRNIILSEIGLTNAQGVAVQAAAICASYMAAKQNPYIDEIIYLLAYSEPGIDTRLSGQSQAVFNSLGTPNEAIYTEWAKAFIGITDWSQILK